jgi:3-isopropylmalate dehydrogenase
MFRHSLGRPDLAAWVEAAVDACIDNGVLTADIGGNAGTTDVGAAVIAALPAQQYATSGVSS